jgi:hypothetical protein
MNRFQIFKRIAELRERIERNRDVLRRPRTFNDQENPLDILNDAKVFPKISNDTTNILRE